MATATLVDSNIEIGRRILAALTWASIPVSVSLWAFFSDVQEWRFVIATPLIDTKGPLAAYREINKTLRKEGLFEDTPLTNIFLQSPNDRVLKELAKESKTVPRESYRIVNAPISGTFVKEAYLYTGTIHIVREAESGPEEYLAVYAPHRGPKRGHALLLDGIEHVRQFLDKKVHIPAKLVESATRELHQRGAVSIPNVQLKSHDVKRLGLA
jgi:hypothetical protein